MKAWIGTLWNASLLRTEAFTGFRDRRDVFFQGFLIIVVVSLLVGLPALVGNAVKAVQPASTAAELENAKNQIEGVFDRMAPFMSSIPESARQEMLAQIKQNMESGFSIGEQIANLRTMIPKPISGLFEALGGWASLPFVGSGFPLSVATLATWLGYGIWVMLVAKLLGGRGTLAGFLGTTALYAAPHVLNIFAGVPLVGSIIGVIAFLWGLAVYVKATAVSHDLTVGRALLAVILPVIVIILLAMVLAGGVAAIMAGALTGRS